MPEEGELVVERNQDVEVEERRMLQKYRRDCFCWFVSAIAFFAVICLCIYFVVIGFERETFIFTGVVLFGLTVVSSYCTDHLWKKYKRQRRIVNYRATVRRLVPVPPRNEEPEAETDSKSSSSQTDSPDPAAEGPSNLPQTESSTLSEQASIQESSEKTSSSDSTKPTSTTTDVIVHEAEAKISDDISSAAEENIANRNEEESSKPTSS